MSKAGLWKNIFGHKEKVVVDVGGRPHAMTHTQKFRFEELRESQRELNANDYKNPLEDSRYSLDDAAFRLMLDPSQVLEIAITGRYRIYVDASGLTGIWRRREVNGTVSQSEVGTIQSGVLKLRRRSIRELVDADSAQVDVFDYCSRAATTDERLDNATLSNLQGWGPGDKQFFPVAPMVVDRDSLILLPPLN